MLWDAGPLVALLDKKDPYHDKCVETIVRLPSGKMVTTWPCLTEGMYLLARVIGLPAQDNLWDMIERGKLSVTSISEKKFDRMRTLMKKYRDSPMDFADASLVVAAEKHNERRIFTFDQHFHAYLIYDKLRFDVVP